MKKKVIIAGGGFAGLSSAVYLSQKGFHVEVIESAPKLGGRAYSFKEEKLDEIIDNGQHLLMGCYDYTLDFLKLIGGYDKLIIPGFFNVVFFGKDGKEYSIKTQSNFYPFNLLNAFLKFDYLSYRERLTAISFLVKLVFLDADKFKEYTVTELLEKFNQTEKICRAFWDFIIIGAMNCSAQKASASMFMKILKQMFLRNNFSTKPILPGTGLSELYCEPSEIYLKKNNGSILISEKIHEIKTEKGSVTEILTDKRVITDFDYVVFAIPPYALEKIKGFELNEMIKFNYSPIISAHIKLKVNNLNFNYCGLIESPIHWVFNHKSFINTVTSDAKDFVNFSNEDFFDFTLKELEKYLKLDKKDVVSYKIIKEKRATFIPDIQSFNKRPGYKTKFDNLFLAGDWIETGLPGTIESSVKSGKVLADTFFQSLNLNSLKRLS